MYANATGLVILGIGTSTTATTSASTQQHTSIDTTGSNTTIQQVHHSNSNNSSGSQSIYISNLPTDITQEELGNHNYY